ncbi:hypothetical protein ACGF1Z_08400 [Streptomyces sp. NPDC048018]|uniref:hypothetical protein n=1 Tax=Streptomyces sp. NPDC048018 TaxID=3365499 RepID=UPI00371432C8
MRQRRRWFPASLLASVLALAGCGQGSHVQVEVAQKDLVGRWADDAGGSMVFASDHTFRFTSVALKSDVHASCPRGDSSGRWDFLVEDEESEMSDPRATSGKSAALHFDGQSLGACVIAMNFIDDGKSLCLSDDPDDLCSVGAVFSREKKR